MNHQHCIRQSIRGSARHTHPRHTKGNVMLKSVSTSMILRGALALAVGLVALAWPGVTVVSLVILFALYAFLAAGLEAARAVASRSAGPVAGHLLVGAVNLAAGALALAWPGPTALVLVLVVAGWAVLTGVLEVYAALAPGEDAGTRARFALGGLVSVAFGIVLFARPTMGAISLALLFGLFNLTAGSWLLSRGVELRRSDTKLRSLAAPAESKLAA
jgi:uncharacterized membrane protein HdeD (DUF308 family)